MSNIASISNRFMGSSRETGKVKSQRYLPRTSWLRCRREWTDFRLALGIGQRPELGGNAAGDRCGLSPGLETCEVGPIAPCERAAQADLGLHGGVMDDIDRTLVVWCALTEAREVTEISARREERCHAGDLRNLLGILQAF